jgi:glycosyltransferase involved in cell wall biosynthesis
MKVLFCSRLDILEVLGGDTIQILETKAALERRGLHIDIGTEAEPDVSGYDLVHIFNTQFPALGLPQLRAVKRQGRKVALSTIYWDLDAVFRSRDYLVFDQKLSVPAYLPPAMVHGLGQLMQLYFELRTHFREMIRSMLVEADALLPNSVAELEILIHQMDYTMARSKAFIVPNAVKPGPSEVVLSDKSKALLDALPARYLIEAARVESVKGQLPLLRATAKWCPDIPLVFVGGHANPSRYFDEFEKECRKHGNAHYLGIIPHEELPAFYARAKVHALPSLRESPGLATLEAALRGANCVVGVHAPVQEYFGNDVWVCDPADVDSIGQAVKAAWIAPNHARMAERIRREFTWDRAADETLRAYEFVLGRRIG